MDAFSDVLRVIRLSGSVFLEARFSAPWCVSGRMSAEDCKPFQVAPRHVIGLHYVSSGRMHLRIGDGAPIEVGTGELVLLPHNDAHVLGSEISDTPVSAGELVRPSPAGEFAHIEHGGGGESTQLLCGFLGTDHPFGPLLSSLPAVLKLDVGATPIGAWVESSFRFAASQVAPGRVGSSSVVAKLAELLFVEAVSHYIDGLPADKAGWLAGVRDPNIGRALALLHGSPGKDWTAEALAIEVGMSRSGFAERFTSLVGQSPMHYLTYWRMQLAARQLRESRDSVAKVGYAVGYESEAAFSRAFKREFGASPAEWRRRGG